MLNYGGIEESIFLIYFIFREILILKDQMTSKAGAQLALSFRAFLNFWMIQNMSDDKT